MSAAERADHRVLSFTKPKGRGQAGPCANAKPVLLGPAEMLALIVPALGDAERAVAKLREMVDRERRRLATERGVSFIREEHVRREFGGSSRCF